MQSVEAHVGERREISSLVTPKRAPPPPVRPRSRELSGAGVAQRSSPLANEDQALSSKQIVSPFNPLAGAASPGFNYDDTNDNASGVA